MDQGNERMDVKQKLKEMSAELDGAIKSYIADEKPANLIEACRQYPYAGGKRMRPAMVVAACRAVGGDGKKAFPMAAAIEYIHNFTLIHDDLMDGDEQRRGMKTSHVIYGMPTAILAGDGLFAKAFDIIADLDIPAEDMKRVLKVTSVAVWDLARGQQMDVNNENEDTVSMEDYIETIRLKTSVLFAAGAASGAIIGGADESTVNAVHEYAMNLGVAFQMYDDILGIYGDPEKTGKSAGILLAALISMNLAILNILPIPALDGGHLMFLLIEKIKGGPLEDKVVEKISSVFFTLLIILMIFIVFNDITLLVHK